MHNIKVVVVGEAGTGKSTLSELLHEALNAYGIENEVVDQDGEGARVVNFKDHIDRIRELNTHVTITQEQSPRNS